MANVTRRRFLTTGGLALLGLGIAPDLLRRTAEALDSLPRGGRRKVLVVVFMRGAVDGLNVVVPHGSSEYYAARPAIAIAKPGSSSLLSSSKDAAAIDLDGYFGFHPRLAALKPFYDSRELALVHAVGSPDNTRSHFDAQDYMESGTPGVKSTADGWVNRYLRERATAAAAPLRAVAVAARKPRCFEGAATTLVLRDIASFGFKPKNGADTRRAEAWARSVERLYASTADATFAATAHEMFDAIRVLDRIREDGGAAGSGEYPRGPLGKSLGEVAKLVKADVGLEVAFVEIGGWDHHANEGSVDGQLARNLEPFAAALAAFRRDLGPAKDDVLVVTMSEFGRTVRENGNRGTDHGHGNVMMVLGSGVRGGKVYGSWPGLARSALFEERDLAVTTDFRDVLGEILVRHLGCDDASAVFPGYRTSRERFRGFLA